MLVNLALVSSLFVFAGTAAAATQTVTLAVKGMTCPVCPITVKKALNRVAGVTRTEVRFKRKEAIVTFDNTKTNVGALIKATTDAGYPSTAKSQ
ncbi:MAG: mercury resistance system periplasmic binding protein MerP [Acidiferrobacterales bacterium]